jgi:hypothetical protein
MTCAGATDWFGWTAALLATAGSLALIRPLFFLLQHREALETLIYALDSELAPEELKKAVEKARKSASAKVFAGRKKWKPWAYAGLASLALSLVPLFLQAACLAS